MQCATAQCNCNAIVTQLRNAIAIPIQCNTIKHSFLITDNGTWKSMLNVTKFSIVTTLPYMFDRLYAAGICFLLWRHLVTYWKSLQLSWGNIVRSYPNWYHFAKGIWIQRNGWQYSHVMQQLHMLVCLFLLWCFVFLPTINQSKASLSSLRISNCCQ